jgi:hypothetical protein
MAKKRTVLGWIAKTFGGSEEDRTGEIVKEAARSDAPQVAKMTNEARAESSKTVLGVKPSRPADPNVPAENMAALATAAMKAMGKDPDEEKKKKKAQGK